MNAGWVVCGVALVGCSSGGAPQKKKHEPQTHTLDAKDNSAGGYDLDLYGVKGSISIFNHTVDLKVPEGTTGTLDGRPLTVNGKTIQGPFVLGDSAAGLDLAAVQAGTATTTMELALVLGTGDSAKASLALDAMQTQQEYERMLSGVALGPLTFGGDTPAGASAKTLVLVHVLDNGVKLQSVLGGATKVTEVDLVAIDTEDEHDVKCPHEYSDGSHSYTVNRIVWDDEVVVFDRRTGKQTATQSFKGKVPKCTRTTTGDFYGDDNAAAIAKWLQTLVAT